MPVGPVQSGGTTLRPELSVLLNPWDMEAATRGYIGNIVAPFFDVPEATGIYPKLLLAEILQEVRTRREEGGTYPRVTTSHESDLFACEEHGLEELIDDRARARNDRLYDVEAKAADKIRQILMRSYEKAVADHVKNDGDIASQAAGGLWTTTSTDVFDDNRDMIQDVEDQCGMPANTLVVTSTVFNALRDNDEIVSRIKYSGLDDPKRGENDVYANGGSGRGITANAIAQAFGLDQVVIAGAKRNGSNVAQTAALSSVWDDTRAYYMYLPEGDPFLTAAPFVTFHWDGDGSSQEGMYETYVDDKTRSTVLRVRHDRVIKTLNPLAVKALTGVSA